MPAMTDLTADELTGMRNVISHTRNQNATIKRPAGVSDARGQRTTVYSTIATSVGVRVQVYAKPGEVKLGERTNALTLFAIYFPHDQDVTPQDRIEVGAAVYEILDVTDSRAIVLERVAVASRIQ
jgi:hypothetical protein